MCHVSCGMCHVSCAPLQPGQPVVNHLPPSCSVTAPVQLLGLGCQPTGHLSSYRILQHNTILHINYIVRWASMCQRDSLSAFCFCSLETTNNSKRSAAQGKSDSNGLSQDVHVRKVVEELRSWVPEWWVLGYQQSSVDSSGVVAQQGNRLVGYHK